MRSSLFWDVTRRRLVIIHRCIGTTHRYHIQPSSQPYRRFGTTYRSHLQGSNSPTKGSRHTTGTTFKDQAVLPTFRNNLSAPSSRVKQPYRCFATTHRYHIQASSSLTDVSEKPTGPIFNGQATLPFSRPEISVNNY